MNKQPFTICRACLLVVLLVAAGCGGQPCGAVAGKVTLNGHAVDDGTIAFIPAASTSARPVWTEIAVGQYAIEASRGPAVGLNRVEIRWARKTGRKMPSDPSVDERMEAVPSRYNRDSELKVDVKPSANQFDFALESPSEGKDSGSRR